MKEKTKRVIKAGGVLLISLITSPIRAFAGALDIICRFLPDNGREDLHTQYIKESFQGNGWHTIGASKIVSPTAVSLSRNKNQGP
jgi:hypothetical protein